MVSLSWKCLYLLLFSFLFRESIQQEVIDRDNVVEKLLEIIQKDSTLEKTEEIRAGNFIQFINNLGIPSCKEGETTCSKCVNTEKYLEWLQLQSDTIINEENVKKLIDNIVYVFVRKSEVNSAVCKEFDESVFTSDTSTIFNEIVEKYGHENKLYLENLYHLTSDISHILKHHFDRETCLSTHTIATILNLSHEVTSEELTMFNLFLVYYLAVNECNPKEETKPESFINDIFKKYGNSTHISKDQFTELLKKLKIGSVHDGYTEMSKDSIFHLSHYEHTPNHNHHTHDESSDDETKKSETSHKHRGHHEHSDTKEKESGHEHSHDDDGHSHGSDNSHDNHAGHDHGKKKSTEDEHTEHKHEDHSSHHDSHDTHQTEKKKTSEHKHHDSHDSHDDEHEHSHGHGHNHGHEHSHRRRRSIDPKCLSAKSLYKTFDFTTSSVLTKDQFKEICPALIQQIDSESCKNFDSHLPLNTHDHDHGKSTTIDRDNADWKPWIGAMLATFFVSLGSLSGVIALPIHGKPFFSYILMTLICLAVATLAGDAILHLIPHSIGVHSHEEEGDAHDHEEKDTLSPDSFLWKFVLVIAGVYGFFLFEMLMHIFGSRHSHSHSIDHDDDSIVDALHHSPTSPGKEKQDEALKACSDDENLHYEQDTKSKLLQLDHNTMEHCEKQCEPMKTNVESGVLVENGQQDVHYHTSDESIHTSTDTHDSHGKSAFKSIVWMVLLGDAIHNFVDGVAIGVAFSEPFPAGLQGGISTSIAILCHELPHELGDFAVLISSGMSIKKALLMNFISSLTAFAGALIGVSIGTKWDATPWIFALTAGLFIYIAFVDMLPEVLNNKLLQKRPLLSFILQNVGLLAGFFIMFSLAAWEEKIIQLLQ